MNKILSKNMKLKKKIKALKAEIKGLKKPLETDSITLVDSSNPNCKVMLSIKDGDFTIQKVTTETKENIELIIKDKK